jgi:hypothetical protein
MCWRFRKTARLPWPNSWGTALSRWLDYAGRVFLWICALVYRLSMNFKAANVM